MTPCGRIDLVSVRLHWNEPWNGPPAPHLLRGALCERIDDPDFHQHDADGECLYRYPRIQYRWDGRTGDGVVYGFGEAGYKLAGLPWQGIALAMGEKLRRVERAEFSASRHAVMLLPAMRRYRLRTCWLALNQRCHDDWRRRDAAGNREWLDRHAAAGVLTALRGLGVEVPGQVLASFHLERTRTCQYKDLSLIGFLGTLAINLDLPDGLGIGKAVSHGFGWLERET